MELPTGAIFDFTELSLQNNSFHFVDIYWIYKKETVMVTPLTVFYADIVMGHHKKQTLIPKHKIKLYLLCLLMAYHFGIFVPIEGKILKNKYKNYCTDLNKVSSLTWECFILRTIVNILDITFTILPDRYLNFLTYQNPQNIYLYLPSHSSQLPGTLYRKIFGTL